MVKSQIYIFLLVSVLFSCKTDVEPINKGNVILLNYDFPRQITRENTSFGLFKVDELNIDVYFDHQSQQNYNLYMESVDTISFYTNGTCITQMEKGQLVDSSLEYHHTGSIELVSESLSCSLIDTAYIGVKITSKDYKHQERFGYMRINQVIKGYWIIDQFVYHSGNHTPIMVGQFD